MAGYVLFKDGKVVGGEVKREDVPKYLPALDQMQARGQRELFDSTLSMLVETGHPLALVRQFRHLMQTARAAEALVVAERVRVLGEQGDSDAAINWAAWVLAKEIVGEAEDALDHMARAGRQGFGHLTHAAAWYWLRRALEGEGDSEENNRQLAHWAEICEPKLYVQFKKGKVPQKKLLAVIAEKAGFKLA